MSATRRIVLDLPVEQADRIDAEVAAGRYASASDFIAARLAGEDASAFGHGELDWTPILAEAAEEERKIDAGEAQTYTVDEVVSELRTRLSPPEASRKLA